MTSIIRAQNQILRLVRASNGCVKRPLSISCISPNMDEFHKHRKQQKILEKISRDAQANFDPRPGAEIRAEKGNASLDKHPFLKDMKKSNDSQRNILNQLIMPVKDALLWIKQKWLPKSKFRFLIIGSYFMLAISLISLGPVYLYGKFKALLGIQGSNEMYWERKEYKNPIVGNPAKAERKDWVFQDTPRERFARMLGFGSDWMTELPIEERIKFWDWPWEDWAMYDAFPGCHRDREFDIPTSYISNPEFKNAQICPDCWRMMLYSCAIVIPFMQNTTFKIFPMVGVFLASVQLGWGNTGNDPMSYGLATLFGLPDFITGNKQTVLESVSSATRKLDFLPSMESGDWTDKNWVVWKYSFQRRTIIPRVDTFINSGLWSKAVMAGQRYHYEMEMEHYIYSMAEIDEHVRKMEPEMRLACHATEWEYGRDYPLVELVNMINSRALTDKKYAKGRRDENIIKNTALETSGNTTEHNEEREIDIFMKSLEAKFQEAEAKNRK